MPKSFITRPYKSGDETKIILLLELVFNGWPKIDLPCSLTDHWKWLYTDNPEKINTTVVAESEGEIIGAIHGLFVKVKIGNQIFLCCKGTDLAVNPNARGMGVYTKIAEIQDKIKLDHGTCMNIGQSKNPIVINKQVKNEKGYFPFPTSIRILLKIKDIEKHLQHTNDQPANLNKILIKPAYNAAQIVNKAKNILNFSKNPDSSSFNVKKIDRFDDRINIFWDEIKDHYDFIVEKSMNYLNWRFCDPRGGEYEVWIAEKDNKILGYIVLRINSIRKDYPLGFIMDVLALPNNFEVVDVLVRDAVKYFDEKEVNVVYVTMVKDHPFEEILDRYGFLNSREEAHVGVIPINLGAELERFFNANSGRLHYTYGESDTI